MQHLTSAQQAALVQFVESTLINAGITGLLAIAALTLSGGGPLNWSEVLFAFVLGFLYSVAHAIVAYLKPQHPVEAGVVDSLASALETRLLARLPTPLQGSVQGPLVVVHAAVPQNASTMSVAQSTTSAGPNPSNIPEASGSVPGTAQA